jgi:hypothetical protein
MLQLGKSMAEAISQPGRQSHSPGAVPSPFGATLSAGRKDYEDWSVDETAAYFEEKNLG